MFTPKNFYDVIYENYVSRNKDEVMFIPMFDGAKQLGQFESFGQNGLSLDLATRMHTKYFFMYDQEPLLSGVTATYTVRWTDSTDPAQHQMIKDLNDPILITWFLRTTSFPIWCHSELHSQTIEQFANHGFVPCYYWYHAFIARDWYRLWQFNRSLAVVDKSQVPFRFLLYCRDTDGTRAYRKTVLSRLATLGDKIQTHRTNLHKVTADYSAKIDTHDAETCGIHLVAETLFDSEKLYLTEKVFKPMVMSQPFIIFGPAGTLRCLRDYGFQTFGHVWDESYDQESDPDRRLHKICDLVNNLADLPQTQYQEIYQSCLPAVLHNRKYFFSDGFMDRCWRELDRNFQSAIAQRAIMSSSRPWGQFLDVMGSHPEVIDIDFIRNLTRNMLLLIDDGIRKEFFKAYPHVSGV